MVDDEEHRVVFVDTAEGLVFHCVCMGIILESRKSLERTGRGIVQVWAVVTEVNSARAMEMEVRNCILNDGC